MKSIQRYLIQPAKYILLAGILSTSLFDLFYMDISLKEMLFMLLLPMTTFLLLFTIALLLLSLITWISCSTTEG